jgi:elongation of very long chain fatty acids protein 4
MIIYNLYQTLFNILSVCGFIYVVYSESIPLAGLKFEPNPQKDSFWLGFLLYLHYQNKYLELLDTVFMILRKKNDQISFLHVEHHTIMVGVWYTVLRHQPGGDPWFGAFANSVIHSMMYAYYFMALLKISCPWKKYVTQAQLIQFVACLCQALYVIYLGSTPLWLACVQIAVMMNMLILFGNFYGKRYSEKPPSATAKKEE